MAEQRVRVGEGSDWLSDLPVQRKMLTAFGLLVVMLALIVVVFLYGRTESADARENAALSERVLVELADLGKAIVDQETSVRGYIISADRAFLAPLEEASRQYTTIMGSLRDDTRSVPEQQSRLDEISAVYEDWQRNVLQPQIALTGAGNRAEAQQMVVRGEGKRRVDAIRASIKQMQETAREVQATRLQRLLNTERLSLILVLATAAAGLLTALAAVWLSTRQITAPLTELTGLMTRLAEHDHSIVVPDQQRKDEIGGLARALQVFKQMAIDTRDQTWIKSSSSKVSALLQDARSVESFASVAVSEIAQLLGAGLAVFYRHQPETETLELVGSYGFRERKHVGNRYKLGEGLVGQCARERKAILLSPVPQDYVRIESGTGEAAPDSILVLPLMSKDELLGVIELATFGQLGKTRQALMDDLAPLLALSFQNLVRALRTQDLLEESQTQAEELQASEEALRTQQEELRATNEELEEKSRTLEEQSKQLKVSEEELRAQTEELQATNEELREKGDALGEQKRMLEDLQKDTERKAEELARASQYKSEFLANMSHELRTPLNSLLILSKDLAENTQGNLDKDQVESAEIIHDAGSNLLRLINDILDLSKVEAGKMEVLREDMLLADFAGALNRSFRHVARQKQIDFTVTIDEDLPPTLHTDAKKLEQITYNLLSNAFKFTETGSVSVRIGRPAADADLGKLAGSRDQVVAFEVSDSGVGIPQDKLDKIFEAFEQVDGTTSRKYGGTGLGLSIARGMTALLGGELRVTSVFGEGATFSVYLPEINGPAAAPKPVTKPEAAPKPAPAKPKRTQALPSIPDDRDQLAEGDTVILVVEDDPAFAKIVVDLTRKKGFRALHAADGETAVALAQKYRPTGVLLDIMLPGMDGWQVMEQIKADAKTRQIPVHFISATEDASRGLEMGAVGFLTKPVSGEAMQQAFDKLLHFSSDKSRRLLLVDDDPGSRKAVRTLIALENVEIDEADTAEAGLALLKQHAYDCVILDLRLPGASGFDFLQQAAQLGPVPPVVIYSGQELSDDETLRLRAYTDSIVVKGARSPQRLLDEVSLFLHRVNSGRGAVDVAEGSGRDLAGHKLLLVDDDMRNLYALSKTLRARGLDVVMAQDGQKALNTLGEDPKIELVLMDIMMPGMDGYETMRRIRAQPKFQKLPIIALTAKAMRGDREKCLEAGANDYLSKPVDVDKLTSMMRVWLS